MESRGRMIVERVKLWLQAMPGPLTLDETLSALIFVARDLLRPGEQIDYVTLRFQTNERTFEIPARRTTPRDAPARGRRRVAFALYALADLICQDRP